MFYTPYLWKEVVYHEFGQARATCADGLSLLKTSTRCYTYEYQGSFGPMVAQQERLSVLGWDGCISSEEQVASLQQIHLEGLGGREDRHMQVRRAYVLVRFVVFKRYNGDESKTVSSKQT
jgi:hypothetical protein